MHTQNLITRSCLAGGPFEGGRPLMSCKYGHNVEVINKSFAYDELGHLVNVLWVQAPEENNNNTQH